MVKYGILVISHGSRSGDWVRLVDEAVEAVRVPEGVPVYSSFLEIVEGRLIQDGITHLESLGVTDIIVVPLFVSSGSTHIDEISYALGVKDKPLLPTDLEPFAIRARIHFTSPIDDDPIIADIIYAKIKALSRDPQKEILLLVGHGSIEKGFHLLWRRGMEKLAMRLQALGGFDEAEVAMLLPDQISRKMKWWLDRKPEHTVIVAPLFLSAGYFTGEVIPERLSGYEYRYNGEALLPHPGISRWIERQVEPYIHGIAVEIMTRFDSEVNR
ncbi:MULTISPECIES: CbiX/SirB N-terminal domain-containing protein [unclassified Paenibacillus]|uniref:sirohydrochlorin chelatase n=1 Tax=unclassified Paenibacillus TaxID=185978 RepID=UPI001AE4B6AB|nr:MULTISPECIES: CbiX/SirB N-terminal domain-containing protein [unclassified Paenibacillus]MBP1153922.1 sirohydrochlorin ferrochelatase [Paenibacillus sp. PvP091]MBP1170693.1 sirohydrochlorin ferrochelatase [Paenibacillus sp. PvR098]MBP2441721.1 sirohydrochlorin ferrochelatase [Paenibacillus sp. PvP052]